MQDPANSSPEGHTIIGLDGKTYTVHDTLGLSEQGLLALKLGKIRALSAAIVKAIKEFDAQPTYERARMVKQLEDQRRELQLTLPGLKVVT